MKKYSIGLLSLACIGTAWAETPWWQQQTICRLDPTNCYQNMGIGYETGMWDATANCWGIKLICPEALTTNETEPTPVGRGDIASSSKIKSDFDVSILNGDCFGMRKTTANGTMASLNGNYIQVWCNGILRNPDENIASGEITYSAQPTCQELANNGYIAVLNNKCYGKYFDETNYLIECSGSNILPSRLVILNGANYTTKQPTTPVDQSSANTIFDTMHQVSINQRAKYFHNN